jgi:hypothetical protein
VLAFPCHQELSAQELDWMCTRLAEVLAP